MFLLLSCFLFLSVLLVHLLLNNRFESWANQGETKLEATAFEILELAYHSEHYETRRRVDVSYIFQSDLVTELKHNFRIEDVEATILWNCNHILVLIAQLVGKYVQIQNFFRFAQRCERFL